MTTSTLKTATVKQIFNHISMLNPTVSEISSMGAFVSKQNQQVSDDKRNELLDVVSENSLAYKILSTSKNLTDKQLWVIAFELEKNEEFGLKLAQNIDSIKRRKNAKKQAKKDANQAILESLKSTPKVEEKKETSMFGLGAKVYSEKFGEGVIIEEDDNRATIDFNEGRKSLIKRFANLTVI